jgi:hypothetical protein
VVQNDEERVFRLRTNAYYFFFVGVDRNGIPSLMVPNAKVHDEIILYQFNEVGELTGKESRLRPPNLVWVRATYEFHRLPVEVPEELVLWQEDIGFKHQIISLREFFDEESGIGIRELPEHYQEFLASPKAYIEWLWEGEDYTSDELDKEVEEWHEEIKRWKDEGMFVFWCGNDYWCNKQGEVTSS